jgi:hypothetical protein
MPRLKNPRRWKWTLRILLALDLLAILSVVGYRYVTRWRGETELAAVVAELDATDPGWRLPDLLAAREANLPPESENIVAVIAKALPENMPAYLPWQQYSEEWFPGEDPNRKANPDNLVKARRVRDDCRPIIDELRKIRSLKSGGSRLDPKRDPYSALVDGFQPLRKAVGILEMDAIVASHEDNPERAFTSVQAALGVARGLNADPFYISWLARYGISGDVRSNLQRVLAQTDSVAALPGLQADLLDESNLDLESVYRRGERAYLYYMFDNMDAHIYDMDDSERSDPQDRYTLWHERSRIPRAQAAALRFQTQLLANSLKPEDQRPAAYKASAGQLNASVLTRKGDKLLGSYLSLITIFKDPYYLDCLAKSRLRMAVAAIACERYRKQVGHWPEKLQDIPNTILASIPNDAISGLPLRCTKTTFGLIVSAVEPGETKPPDYSKPGAALPKECFRLWDVSQRGLPPRP